MADSTRRAEQWYFEDIGVGDVYHIPSKTITETHFVLFAGLTGDFNPIHVDRHYAEEETPFGERIAHSTMVSMFAIVGASQLEPHIHETARAYRRQSMEFPGRAYIGDTIYPRLEVAEKANEGEQGVIFLESKIYNQDDELIVEGEIELVLATREE